MDPIIQFAGMPDDGEQPVRVRRPPGPGRPTGQNSQQQRGSQDRPGSARPVSASAAAAAAMTGFVHGRAPPGGSSADTTANSGLSWQQQMLLGRDGPGRGQRSAGPPQQQRGGQHQGNYPQGSQQQPYGGPQQIGQQQQRGGQQGGRGGQQQQQQQQQGGRGGQQQQQQQQVRQGGQQAPRPASGRPAPQQPAGAQDSTQQGLQGGARPQSARPPRQGRPQSARPGAPAPSAAQQQPPAGPQDLQRPPAASAGPALTSALQGPRPVNATALQHHSDVRFDSLAISDLTKRAMSEVFGYEMCTKVQAQAIPVCLSGDTDVLAKAKTGTGKTIAFMIPTIERLLRTPPRPGQVGAVVLSPTRELAMQIHVETEKLLKFHRMKVQFVIGGTNINAEAKRLQNSAPQVLVGTPGRFLDHLTNNNTGLERMMQDLRSLVLDEADNILDMGFRPTIEKILAALPDKRHRQTLLFSATFPSNVKELAGYALRPQYSTVDTVGEEVSTNAQVEQMSCVVPHEEMMLYLNTVIKMHMQQDAHYKVICFFPTARVTQLYAETFQHMGMPVLEIHSRKSQAVRTRCSDDFRARTGVVLFSSDVSARGVDYPDVTLVVQVGLPADRDQYIHRVGRTSRAGKAGQSLVLLADFEAFFLRKLNGLPIRNLGQLASATIHADAPALTRALSKVPADTKGKAYAAFLGFYKSAPGLSMSVGQLVETANHFSRIIGCKEPPELEAKTIGKMGLKGVPGLRVQGKKPPPPNGQPPRQ